MFNHLCNYINLQILDNVESIEQNGVTLKPGIEWDRINSEKKPEWSEPPARSNSGTIYNQTFRIVTDKLSADVKDKYAINRPIIAILYDDDGEHIFGDFDQLARITINPTTDKESIQLSRQSTEPIY